MDVEEVRGDFPMLKGGLIYLDSTASSLTPNQVLDAVNEYYTSYRANIHRGVYRLSLKASDKYDEAREKVASFINCRPTELIFNRNTTEGINQVALGLDLRAGDRVLTTAAEHHSNLLPWMKLRERGVELDYVYPDSEGHLSPGDFKEKIVDRTRIVAVNHVSNVLGIKNPVEEIGRICRRKDVLFLIDGAQSTPHLPIDVKEIGCDFFAFSGHKMLAPTGIGALYMRQDLINELEPAYLGGGTIRDVSLSKYVLDDSVERWEPGTPDISGAIGLGRAVEYLKDVGLREIERHEARLTEKLLGGLAEIKYLTLYGSTDAREKIGIATFHIDGVGADELAKKLDLQKNICVRSGYHCAMPLLKDVIGKADECSLRASLYIYNTESEIDMFTSALKELI